jgi:DNA-directed RNA polymerase specialized sigma subunit
MTDYRVTVTVKNARILRAMERAGFDSVAALSREMGISSVVLHNLLSMRTPPINRGAGRRSVHNALRWSKTAERLAFTLQVPVEELFSQTQRYPTGALTRKSVDVSETDVRAYIASASYNAPALEDGLIKKDTLRKIIIEAKLDAREDEIVAGTFFENKYSPDFAEKFGISRARSDQIRDKALRKLKAAADRLHVGSAGLFK